MRALKALVGIALGLSIGLLLVPVLEFFGFFLGVFLAAAGGMIGAAPAGRHLATALWAGAGLLIAAVLLMFGGIFGLLLGVIAVVWGGMRGMRGPGAGSPPPVPA